MKILRGVTIRQIIASICFGAVFLLLISYATGIFLPKYSYEQLEDYNKIKKNTLDTLYIGTSHFACGIAPMQIWADTGLTGYNLATAAQGPPTTYFISTDALRRHKPKVVFLEMSRILEDYDSDHYHQYIRRALDPRLITKEKLEVIMDVRSHGKEQSFKNYILPLTAQHKRWSELNGNDFKDYDNRTEKGQRFVWAVKDVTPAADALKEKLSLNEKVTYKYNKRALKYYQKTVDLYKKNNVKVVLIGAPEFSYTSDLTKAVNAFAKKNDLDFINFNDPKTYEKSKLDPVTDYYVGGHLNPWGAVKMSKYLSNYLKEEFPQSTDSAGSPETHEYWLGEYEKYYSMYKDFFPEDLTKPEKLSQGVPQ